MLCWWPVVVEKVKIFTGKCLTYAVRRDEALGETASAVCCSGESSDKWSAINVNAVLLTPGDTDFFFFT